MAIKRKGHALRDKGAAFNTDGKKLRSEVGRGLCTCGIMSDDDLPTDSARRDWHQRHLGEIDGTVQVQKYVVR